MSASPTSPARTPTPTSAKPTVVPPLPPAEPASPPTPSARSPSLPAATASPLNASPTSQPPIIHPDSQTQPDANPKVFELHAMFPTVELSVIELVLETCGGSTDRAIEQLLAMSDPNFKPDELKVAKQDHQVDLDAEFARSLQLQDEEEYRTSRSRYEAAHGSANSTMSQGELPYQPRVRRSRPSQPQGFSQPEVDSRFVEYESRKDGENPPGMLYMEERLEKLAEAGKQTFNSFLSRAKQKYSEFQAAQAQRSSAQGYGGGQGQRQEYDYSGYGSAAPGGGRGGEQSRGHSFGSNARSHSPSISGTESISSQSTADPTPPQSRRPTQSQAPVSQQSKRWQPSDAYDDPLPPRSTSVPHQIEVAPSRTNVGSPDKGKIDPAKLGILPKKRVDLMSTSPSASSHLKSENKSDDDDPNPSLPNGSLMSRIPPTPPAETTMYKLEDSDDDELEYTKNPFDEK
ncbi:hypothetical protein I305_00388 [Cryptococcus gattii E566]|uniref:CUE domain-containing protein n=2 Tax=Cryptococcus gattii TaxID=37769 RepID=E6QYH1_CRYGW|nr:Hypothetical protein CGB_A8050W [Cryptococcus gattii WM276]ADV19892.1 Hypothetical protein CGB_A8050W [Cryptococcus gattii WM276]KIR79569.1 hypothetical protein I306_03465 [Cryptococcus gattii EJB2]KIY37292.1 hypothetical protein I305_00388 [Cryptococcus gattii E566]KJE01214.1 hypothetical protein I311_05184 [Cryptococcus gattii NT-10]